MGMGHSTGWVGRSMLGNGKKTKNMERGPTSMPMGKSMREMYSWGSSRAMASSPSPMATLTPAISITTSTTVTANTSGTKLTLYTKVYIQQIIMYNISRWMEE